MSMSMFISEMISLAFLGISLMSPDSLSRMLSSLPEDQSVRVMRGLTEIGEYVLMDSTAVFSRSDNISFLELGHNSKGMPLNSLNFARYIITIPGIL